MTLIELIRSLEPNQLDALAERSGTTVGNLKQIAYGYRLAGPGLAINLDRESGRAVTCEELRSDIDWAYLRNSPNSCEQCVA
jgi:DNA-binding transcriptional regulator YdaS (Cro superfamily)